MEKNKEKQLESYMEYLKRNIVHFFDKGFKIYVEKKPKTDEEIMVHLKAYAESREEKITHYKKEERLFIEREGITYEIEVDRTNISGHAFLGAGVAIGATATPWVIIATEVKDRKKA